MDNTSNTPEQTPQTTSSSLEPTPDTVAEIEPTTQVENNTPPTVQDTPKPVKPAKKMGPMLILIALIICIPLAAFGGYTMSKQKADKTEKSLSNKIATLEATTHDLPADTIKVSECIPNMGAHYLTKASDPEYGPFLMVSKKNKVIGVEYMVSKDMYTAIPKTEPPVEVLTKDSPMYGWKFDHSDVSHLPKGHEGLVRDHIDIHLYTVNADMQKNACI